MALCDEAVELAQEYGKPDNDSIRPCYYMIAKPEHHPQPLKLVSDPPVMYYRPDLTAYDGLTGGVVQCLRTWGGPCVP